MLLPIVVFLAVSRRDKASVTVTGDILTARYMADAALARAQSELVARIQALGRVHAFSKQIGTWPIAPLPRSRNVDGVSPTMSLNCRVNVATLANPTSTQISPIVRSLVRRRAIARSIRRRCR